MGGDSLQTLVEDIHDCSNQHVRQARCLRLAACGVLRTNKRTWLPLLYTPGEYKLILYSTCAIEIAESTTLEPTSTAVDSTIARPGAVRINVQGAFIVDDRAGSPQSLEVVGLVHESRDIRLPHHIAVVSHVAVDVSQPGQSVQAVRRY